MPVIQIPYLENPSDSIIKKEDHHCIRVVFFSLLIGHRIFNFHADPGKPKHLHIIFPVTEGNDLFPPDAIMLKHPLHSLRLAVACGNDVHTIRITATLLRPSPDCRES